MRKISLILALIIIPIIQGFAQDPKLDKLEMFYDQGHHAKSLRKIKRLLKDTAYVNHALPYMWKALNTVGKDLKKGKELDKALTKSSGDFQIFLTKKNAAYYIETYNNELLDYQEIWLNQIADYKQGNKKKAEKLYALYHTTFNDQIAYEEIIKEDKPTLEESVGNVSDIRLGVIKEAKSHLGTPYKWGGTDEKGFDCSGYTSYVMAKNGIDLPRMATDQGKKVSKVNSKKAQPGDLIFFGSGSRITHVGIVVSNPGEDLSMIHASSSNGIMISNVESSSYWKPRMLYTGKIID